MLLFAHAAEAGGRLCVEESKAAWFLAKRLTIISGYDSPRKSGVEAFMPKESTCGQSVGILAMQDIPLRGRTP